LAYSQPTDYQYTKTTALPLPLPFWLGMELRPAKPFPFAPLWPLPFEVLETRAWAHIELAAYLLWSDHDFGFLQSKQMNILDAMSETYRICPHNWIGV